MDLLKRIPVHYRGELHDVRLINFSVGMEEVKHLVPAHIRIRDFNGRAMISMVDVQLKRMRPILLPFVRFNYRHIAFRLLVDDSAYNNGTTKGIFFLRAFTDKPMMVAGGRMLTDYNLESANIEAHGNTVLIAQGSQYVRYCIGDPAPGTNDDLKQTIGALDRAYAVLGNMVRVTNIQREKWPIEPVHCTGFENTFFKSARFEGAFRVFETIYYDWFPPEAVGNKQSR